MSLSRKAKKYRGLIGVAVIVAIAGGAYYIAKRPSADDTAATSYTTASAEIGTVSATVSGTGNLEVADSTDVYPESGGTVATVEVDEGDKVKAGQVLFTLDDDDVEAAITKASASYQQSKSSVAQANAQVSKAQSTLAQLRAQRASASKTTATTTGATGSTTVTSADIAAAVADVSSAKASLSSAKASRASAYNDYEDAVAARDDLEVTAPSAGIVWTLDIEEGDSVSASGGSSGSSGTSAGTSTGTGTTTDTSSSSSSSAPVVLVSSKPLVARLSVNEVDIPNLKKGQRTQFEFDALPDLTMTGKVIEISDEGTVANSVVTFDVLVQLDVANKQLKPGMTAAATIVTAVARKAVLVPNAAVKSDDNGGSYVLVMAAGATTPTQVTVETGLSGDTQTQITSGLEGTETVVTAETSASSSSSSSSSNSGRPGGAGMMMMGGGPGQ